MFANDSYLTTYKPVSRQEWILLASGINLTLLNFILVQHFSVALRNPELAVLTFSMAYFSGISLGYYVSDRIPLISLKWLYPAMMPVQMLIIVAAQAGVYMIQRDVSLFSEINQLDTDPGWLIAYLGIFLVTALTATSIYAIFLPAMIEEDNLDLQRCYSLEVIGSIIGLLILPVLAAFSHLLLLSVYFTCFIGIAVLLRIRYQIILALAIISAVFIGNYSSWDARFSAWFYQNWYSSKNIEKVEYTRYTPYHKIEVLKRKDGTFMLTLNGKRQFSHGGHYNYSYFLAEYPARLLKNPRVNLLGCGVMSTIGRIGDFVDHITIVDIDQGVFETSRRYFQQYNRLDSLDNWTFIADDAKHFAANSDDQFELILHDIPPAYSRQIALTYTKEFFTLVKERLTDDGIFSIASLSPISSRSNYGKRLIATLIDVFDNYFVLVKGSSVYFYGGKSSLIIPDEQTLRSAIHHSSKDKIGIHVGSAVDKLVKGSKIITINNIGDLIFDD